MKLNITYTAPDFTIEPLKNSPIAVLKPAPADGIAPQDYHATSNHPEYIKVNESTWVLAPESRMDAVFVVDDGAVDVVEARRLKAGQMIVTGRTENGEEGIFVHNTGFGQLDKNEDKFAFRSRGTRETPFSRSYGGCK